MRFSSAATWKNRRERLQKDVREPASSSDALVFFGATGDLAYKKIFPSLQAMLKRGHLDVPVIGVAKAGWNLDQLKARARDSLEKHGGIRSRRRSTSCRAAALCRRRLQRSRDVPGAAQGTRFGATARALSRHPAGAVRDGGGTTWRARLHRTARASSSKSLSARDLASAQRAQPHPARRRSTRSASSASTTTWERSRCITCCSSRFAQRVPRAVLESRAHRERADHDGRELRRAGPRRVLRSNRHHPRRDPESSVPGPGQPRDGAARPHRQRIDPRRESEGAEGHPTARSQRTSCAASSAATETNPASQPIRRRKPSPR